MDSLYTLCLEWSKLAPEECDIYGDFLMVKTDSGPVSSLHQRADLGLIGRFVFQAVCYHLEQRRVPYQLEGKPSSSILDDTPFYGYSVWSTEFDANPLGLLASTPAHALLGAYLEYLKGQK